MSKAVSIYTNAYKKCHRTSPHHAARHQTNGMVERVNHTIKSATMTAYKYTSVEDMKQALTTIYATIISKESTADSCNKQLAERHLMPSKKLIKINRFVSQKPNAMKEQLLSLNS